MTIGAKQEVYRKLYDADEADQAMYTTTLDEQHSAGYLYDDASR